MFDTTAAFWMFVQSIMLGTAADEASVRQPAPPRPDQAGIECVLDVRKTSDGATILASVSAGPKAGAGRFVLEIEKTGANTAKSRKRGSFDVASGTSETVGVVNVSTEAGDLLKGRLVLVTGEGERSCSL